MDSWKAISIVSLVGNPSLRIGLLWEDHVLGWISDFDDLDANVNSTEEGKRLFQLVEALKKRMYEDESEETLEGFMQGLQDSDFPDCEALFVLAVTYVGGGCVSCESTEYFVLNWTSVPQVA
jgi:hypothetical protein